MLKSRLARGRISHQKYNFLQKVFVEGQCLTEIIKTVVLALNSKLAEITIALDEICTRIK